MSRVRDEQIKLTNLPLGRLVNDNGNVGAIRDNLEAIAAPTSGDDFAAGYAIGSMWIYGDEAYICTGDGSWVATTNDHGSGESGYLASWTSGNKLTDFDLKYKRASGGGYIRLYPTDNTGSNVRGCSLFLDGSKGTGTGVSGSVSLRVPLTGSVSGTTPHPGVMASCLSVQSRNNEREIGFFGASPAPRQALGAKLTNSTGSSSTDGTISAVSTFANCNTNFARIFHQLKTIRNALINSTLMSGTRT